MTLRAAIERAVSPGYGSCRVCKRPWRFVDHHTVDYWQSEDGGVTRGAFALCESCWAKATDDERWSAMYRAHGHRDDWDLINKALTTARLVRGVDERASCPAVSDRQGDG